MHFKDNEFVDACMTHFEDDSLRDIFVQFVYTYDIVKTADQNASYWLFRSKNEEHNIIDHVNAFYDSQGRIVLALCPYSHIEKKHMDAYARRVNLFTELLRDDMVDAELKKCDSIYFSDHIHWYEHGYHHRNTHLIVVDADAVRLLNVLYDLWCRVRDTLWPFSNKLRRVALEEIGML